jgi:hypothetical protein
MAMGSVLDDGYANALKRAALKREVASLLRPLLHEERRTVLLDLLAELSAESPAVIALAPPAPNRKERAAPSKPAKPGGGRGGRAKRGGRFASAGRSDAVLAAMAKRPGMPTEELAKAVYGDSSPKSRAQLRSLLFSLKNKGRVTSPSPGEWQLVEAK